MFKFFKKNEQQVVQEKVSVEGTYDDPRFDDLKLYLLIKDAFSLNAADYSKVEHAQDALRTWLQSVFGSTCRVNFREPGNILVSLPDDASFENVNLDKARKSILRIDAILVNRKGKLCFHRFLTGKATDGPEKYLSVMFIAQHRLLFEVTAFNENNKKAHVATCPSGFSGDFGFIWTRFNEFKKEDFTI